MVIVDDDAPFGKRRHLTVGSKRQREEGDEDEAQSPKGS